MEIYASIYCWNGFTDIFLIVTEAVTEQGILVWQL